MKKTKKTKAKVLRVYDFPKDSSCPSFSLKLASSWEHHIRHAYRNGIPVSIRYIGKNGFCNWCNDFTKLHQAIIESEHYEKGKTAGMYRLQKLNPEGPVTLKNITFFSPYLSVVQIADKHKKILNEIELNRMDYIVDMNIKSKDTKKTFTDPGVERFVKGAKNKKVKMLHLADTFKVLKDEDVPPTWRPYWADNGRKLSLKAKCDHEGVPYTEIKKEMDKYPDIDFEEAKERVLKVWIKAYESSPTAKANGLDWDRWIKSMTTRYPGLAKSTLLKAISSGYIEEGDVINMDVVKKYINNSLGKSQPIYIWDATGLIGEFKTVALAAETLGLTTGYLNNLVTTGNSSASGYWAASSKEGIPKGAKRVIEEFNFRKMLFKATVEPIKDLALTPVQYNILHKHQVEGFSFEKIAEMLMLPLARVKHYAFTSTEQLFKEMQVLTSPEMNDPKSEGLSTESYKDTNTGEPSGEEANRTVSADAEMARKLRTSLDGATPFTAETGDSVVDPQPDKEIEDDE